MLTRFESSFTLLFQDQHGGLEFEDPQTGAFMQAPPREDVVYVTLGDIFTRLSNGEPYYRNNAQAFKYSRANQYPSSGLYNAATHRVSVSTQTVASKSQTYKRSSARYSIAYFVQPDFDETLVPQRSLISQNRPALYEPTTYRKYFTNMIKTAVSECS